MTRFARIKVFLPRDKREQYGNLILPNVIVIIIVNIFCILYSNFERVASNLEKNSRYLFLLKKKKEKREERECDKIYFALSCIPATKLF